MKAFLLIVLGLVAAVLCASDQVPAVREDHSPNPTLPTIPRNKADSLDIEGWYSFQGNIQLGPAYDGVSRIKRLENGNLLVSWYGNDTIHGVGMRDGSELLLGWSTGGQPGVGRMRIEADAAGKPRLVGSWIILQGPKGRHREEWTWLKGLNPDHQE